MRTQHLFSVSSVLLRISTTKKHSTDTYAKKHTNIKTDKYECFVKHK